MTTQHRSSALAGIVFGVLAPISIVTMLDVPTQKGPIDDWTAHLASASDRSSMLVGWLVMCVAVLALGWWLTGLATGLAGSTAPQRHGAALVSGAVMGGLLLVATTTMFSVYGTISIGGAAVPSGELGLHIWYTGFWLLLTPVSVTGAFFIVMTLSAGSELLPRWLGFVGWVFAPLLLTASFIVVTLALLPLWVLLIGILTLVAPADGSDEPSGEQERQAEAAIQR
jgi:hypothetical protein